MGETACHEMLSDEATSHPTERQRGYEHRVARLRRQDIKVQRIHSTRDVEKLAQGAGQTAASGQLPLRVSRFHP